MSSDGNAVFIMNGYAGTGKTSVVSALVNTMVKLQRECVLLAPTGRAAKVLSLASGHPAFTIHRYIYRQKTPDFASSFDISFNGLRQTLFIVDEASMISNRDTSGSPYGTGRLLDDLVQFVYNGRACRLILIGDTAQLPPVGETESVALNPDTYARYGLNPHFVSLREVVRQKHESGILSNATRLRTMIETDNVYDFPKLRLKGYEDIVNVMGSELIDELSSSYDQADIDETIVICRSNKRANIYNNGIRNQILGREEELSSGDWLMVAKNNYYWPSLEVDENGKNVAPMNFIANGDIIRVRRIRNVQELYGFKFATCLISMPDYDDYEMEVKVLLDTLWSESPSLSMEQSEKLFNSVMEDYMDITVKRERLLKIRQDPYYNALQVKYAYAVTCHKAQGGQWSRVFVDQGYVAEDMLGMDYMRWLYTAMTRATDRLCMVNWKEEQIEDD